MTIQQKRSDFIVPRERSPGSEGLNERQRQEIEGTSRACSEGPLFRRLPQLLLRGEGIHLAGSVLQVVVEGTSRGHLLAVLSQLPRLARPNLVAAECPPACSTTVMWTTSSTKQPKGNPAMLLLGALFLFVAGAPGLPIIFTHPPSPSPLPALPHTESRNPPPPPCDILLQDLSHALNRPTTALSRRQSHEFLNQHGPAARGANISRISRWATQSHAHSASAANGSPIATTSTTSHRRDYKSPRPRRNSKNNNNKRYTNTPSPPCYSLLHSHATRRTRHSRAYNPRSSPRRPPARRKFRLTSPSTPSSTRAAPCNPSLPRPRCPSPRRPSHRRTRRIRSSSSFPHHP